ncbi:MAG: InlB B-repeat-containing protein, partial [Lachnospiraceae bacterium]|nr:InlB B-repeat-containing protein [Lachnospiraceae bacterium]
EENPEATPVYEYYITDFKLPDYPSEEFPERLIQYNDGAWTLEGPRWYENSWITSENNGASFEWTTTMSEPDGGIIYAESRYSFSLTDYQNLTEALQAEPNANFRSPSSASYQNPGSVAEEAGGADGDEDDEAYSFSVKEAEEGKLYSLIAFAGELDAFPALKGQEILYIDVKRAAGETLTFACRPSRRGKATVFITKEGESPQIAGFLSGEEEVIKHRVSFDAGGGSGEMPAAEVEEGASYALPSCSFIPPAGRVFDRWDAGEAGDRVTVYEDMVFKAVWKKAAATSYQVVFHENGGYGSMADMEIPCGEKRRLSPNAFARTGYVFKGWTTVWYRQTVEYKDQEEVTDLAAPGGSITLFAVWGEEGEEPTPPGEDSHEIKLMEGAIALIGEEPVVSAKEGEKVILRYTGNTDGKVFKKWILTGAAPVEETSPETSFVMGSQDVIVQYEEGLEDVVYETLPEGADTTTKVAKLTFMSKSLKLTVGEVVNNQAMPTAAKGIDYPDVYYVTGNKDIVSVTQSGDFFAMGTGQTVVTAYCGNKKVSCKVIVSKYTNAIRILDETAADGSYEMKAGEQRVFRVSFEPFDTTDPRTVTWKSSNKKAASVSGGVVTAKEVKQALTTEITASVKYTDPETGKTKTMTQSLEVRVLPVENPKAAQADKSYSLAISKSSLKMVSTQGANTYELQAVITPKKGSAIGDIEIVGWESSNPDVVSIGDITGLAPDEKGKKGIGKAVLSAGSTGTAYIFVKTRRIGQEVVNSKKCKVQVSSPGEKLSLESGSLQIEDGMVTMRLGEYGVLGAKLDPAASADFSKVKWQASGGVSVKNGLVYAAKVSQGEKYASVTVKCGKLSDKILVRVIP